MLAVGKLVELLFVATGADLFIGQLGQGRIIRAFVLVAVAGFAGNIAAFGMFTGLVVRHLARGNFAVAVDTFVGPGRT